MVIWDIFPVFYVGKSKIHEHFCLCTFYRAKPATEAQLGPQLRLSHLALTALQPPQGAETNICWPTLKPTALKLFGLTANNKQKTPKETKIEPQCKKFGRNQLTISPLQQKCTKNSFICIVSSAHGYTATSRFPGAIKKRGKTFMCRRNEEPRGSGQKSLQPARLPEKTAQYPFQGSVANASLNHRFKPPKELWSARTLWCWR